MSEHVDALGIEAVPLGRDARIIVIVGLAHMTSHFFHLILAAVFPWVVAEFGFSYTQLGFIITVLFVVSGCAQPVAGFVVDRWGAGVTLITGLGALAAGAVLFALSNSYVMLLVSAALTGLGNCVFHPVDFSILNHKVSPGRLGPAYSVHGLSGNLGWAAAPVFLVGIASGFGWRAAVLAATLIPLSVIALLSLNRDVVGAAQERPREGRATTGHGVDESRFGFLRRSAIWWCFVFFVMISAALGGVQNFAPLVFIESYQLKVPAAAMSITILMLASAAGMIAGGWLVMRGRDLARNITIALALGGISAVAIGLNICPPTIALGLMAVLGFGIGLSGPSRDMLIRSATPKGATGRVYGVVYSGLDVGIAAGPVLFGVLLDNGFFLQVFFGVAVFLLLAIMTAWRVEAYPDTATVSRGR
jgi:MFS family permease